MIIFLLLLLLFNIYIYLKKQPTGLHLHRYSGKQLLVLNIFLQTCLKGKI